MQKLLRLLVMTLVVLGCSLPVFGKVEAAKIAVMPVVTNEEGDAATLSRKAWNEQCMAMFKFPEFEIVDDTDLEVALKEIHFVPDAKQAPTEALLRQVMAKTKADMAIMLVMSNLSLEPEVPPTRGNYYILTQKGELMLVNNISGTVKTEKVREEDQYDYAVTVRGDFVHEQFRNTITRELKKIMKAK